MNDQKKTIRIACEGATRIEISELQEFQGNLKELSQANYLKLKREILTLGFSEPVSIWVERFPDDPGNKFTQHLLNGHQRVRALKQMREEGYEIPPIPANLIQAKDRKEAKKKVLALTSQYGQMTNQGLYEFMNDAGLELQELEDEFVFPEIDLAEFKMEFFKDTPSDDSTVEKDESDLEDRFEAYKKNQVKQIVLYYPDEEYKTMIEKLNALLVRENLDDYSQLISKLVQDASG